MDPEMLDRTCKKISQLTRVIYLLNTKNEENENFLKSLIQSYDEALENMKREANDSINQYQVKLDKAKDTSVIDSKIREIKRKFDETSTKFSLGFESFKYETKKSKESIENEYKDKYNQMVKEVSDVKKYADKKINDYLKRSEEDKRRTLADKDKEKNALLEEINALKKANANQIAEYRDYKRK